MESHKLRIHELRHYREIKISSEYVREELNLFFEKAWDIFDLMESYKFFPSQELKQKIESDFKTIFEREWNFFMINHCRSNTISRKESLLTFWTIQKLQFTIIKLNAGVKYSTY